MSDSSQLKEWFDEARYRRLAADLGGVFPKADVGRFLEITLTGLSERSLMQRMRRTTKALRAVLPGRFPAALEVLDHLAPRLGHSFVGIVLSDFVGQYGHEHFEESMAALRRFTRFGSAEFAVREFLRRDLRRTLEHMKRWAGDPDEHVRRLASEGCRPRLPWSFRLDELIANPEPVAPILDRLRADSSLYVRKSVANHLNDHSKDNADWVFDRIGRWDLGEPRTAWIVRHALRTLIKQGDSRALRVIGADRRAEVADIRFALSPRRLHLGQRLTLNLRFRSAAPKAQKLVIDYAIHYVKSAGATSRKVFKWKTAEVAAGEPVTLRRSQMIRDFTTRKHRAGTHRVEVLINGEVKARAEFELSC